MHKFLLTVTLFLTASYHAQNFKKGTITLENGETRSGEIFYNIPVETPQTFVYKASPDAKPITFSTSEIVKVEITDITTFSKKNVEINRAKIGNDGVIVSPDYNLIKETLIVENLIKGSKSLYKYNDKKDLSFFYESGQNPIKPLLYKEYYDPNDESIKIKKSDFRQDLNEIACGKIKSDYVKYMESDLIKYFKKVNECSGDNVQVVKKDQFSTDIKIVASKNFIKKDYQDYTDQSYSFGAEFELHVPYFNNALAISLGAHYTTFNTSEEDTKINQDNVKSMINIPLTFRYYIVNRSNIKFYTSVTPFNFTITKSTMRTVFSNNPIVKNTTSNFILFDNIEVGLRYREYEFFGKLNIASKSDTNWQSAAVGVKYNLPFVK